MDAKSRLTTVLLIAVISVLLSCEKFTPVPDYEYVGTSTATLFSLSVSDDAPLVGEEITITISYINQRTDPASSIQTLAKIGEGDFAEIVTMDQASQPVGEAISEAFTYPIPEVDSATTIIFDVLLNTQRTFPQRERVSVTVSG